MRKHPFGLGARGLLAWLMFCGLAARAGADTIDIDFEQFADTTNLHGVNLGGVTLYGPTGLVEVFDDRFGVSHHSGTKAIATPQGLLSLNPLTGIFDSPVSYVSLFGGDAATYVEMDSWQLLAYDAPVGGNLVGQVASGTWQGAPYRQLSLSGESIWRFEAVWTGQEFGIGYDDLSFTPIPYESRYASNASFVNDADQDELVLDFGELALGGTVSPLLFDVWNLPSSGTTADLDLTSLSLIDFSGASSEAFTTDLSPFTGLTARNSKSFSANLVATTPGEYSATYLLSVTDQTGAAQAPLKIVLTGRIVAVPEPSTVVLLLAGLVALLALHRFRR